MSSFGRLTDAARRGVRWTSISAVGSVLLQLLQITVLARLLNPAEFGQMAVVLVLLVVGANFTELGFSSAIIQRKNIQNDQLATLYSLNLIFGCVTSVAIWTVSPLIEYIVDIEGVGKLTKGAAFVFLITPWGMQIRALLQKYLYFNVLAITQLVATAFGTVVAIGFALFGFGVWALLFGYLATETMRTLILIVIGIQKGSWAGFAFDIKGTKELLAFGGFRLAAMVATGINAKIDQLIIGGLMGAAPLGIYNVSQRLALEPVQKINPIVTRVAFPIFSIAQDRPVQLRNGFTRMVNLLLSINAPLLLGLATTAHVVVPLLLGPQWSEAIPIVQLMAIYGLQRCIGNAGGSLVLAVGRADWSCFWNVALLLIVPLTLLTAARITESLLGISVAIVGIYAILLICHYFVLLRRLVGPFGRRYLIGIFRPIIISLVMGLSIWLFDYNLLNLSLFPRFGTLMILGAVVYASISWFLQRDFLLELMRLLRKQPDPMAET